MTADDTGAGRRGRLLVGGLLAVVAVALAAFAFVLADSQRAAREDLEGRLQDRAVAGASVIASVFEASGAGSQAALRGRFGGARITQEALDDQLASGNAAYLAVVEPDGDLLGTAGDFPTRLAEVLRRQPRLLRTAVARRGYGFGAVALDGRPDTLPLAQAFPVEGGGLRVVVTGSSLVFLAQFFDGTLAQLPAVEGGRTLLLDEDGAVLSGARDGRLGRRLADAELLRRSADGRLGRAGGGRVFAAAPVRGTPWRVVLTAPEDELFESIDGLVRWGPWALFGAFTLASLLGVALASRTVRDAGRIATANAELERANAALGERAADLATTNARLAEVNEELERSNQELDRFASIASHDLREPLRKVQMFSERVIHHESATLSERGRDYLRRMDDAAARMQTLIDGLLVYARVASRPEPLQEVDLDRVARDVVADLEAAIRDAGGRVELGPLPTVPAEELRMRQLLQNLIANGLRFRREGVPPVVRVTGRVEGDEAVLEVADDGIGFEPHHAERIFELFERLHPKGTFPGTGMGLALCRRIVERHGGSITASGAPGQGATFTVRLPRTPTEPRA